MSFFFCGLKNTQNTGYGDFCPSNNASKLFTIFIGMIGIIILGILLGMLSEYLSDRQEQRIESRLQNARLKIMEQVRKSKRKELKYYVIHS